MGVTTIETPEAVVRFDHEMHGINFTPEADPNTIDALIIEPIVALRPNNIRQTAPTSPNMGGAYRYAKQNGKDVYVTDVPYNAKAIPEVMKHRPVFGRMAKWIAAGFGVSLAGKLGQEYGKKRMTRRVFTGMFGVGMGLVAVGTVLGMQDIDAHIENQFLLDDIIDVVEDGDVRLNDFSRRQLVEAKSFDSPDHKLRDVFNTLKIRRLASNLMRESGGKPSFYMVYGAAHTEILDLMQDPGECVSCLQHYSRKIRKYFQTDWVPRVTRWHYDETERLFSLSDAFDGDTPGLKQFLNEDMNLWWLNKTEKHADRVKGVISYGNKDVELELRVDDVQNPSKLGVYYKHRPSGDKWTLLDDRTLKKEDGKLVAYGRWKPTVQTLDIPELRGFDRLPPETIRQDEPNLSRRDFMRLGRRRQAT
jgi:hypothetical protein